MCDNTCARRESSALAVARIKYDDALDKYNFAREAVSTQHNYITARIDNGKLDNRIEWEKHSRLLQILDACRTRVESARDELTKLELAEIEGQDGEKND